MIICSKVTVIRVSNTPAIGSAIAAMYVIFHSRSEAHYHRSIVLMIVRAGMTHTMLIEIVIRIPVRLLVHSGCESVLILSQIIEFAVKVGLYLTHVLSQVTSKIVGKPLCLLELDGQPFNGS